MGVTKWKEGFIEAIRAMAWCGLSNEMIAKQLGVSKWTLMGWASQRPEVREALRQGTALAVSKWLNNIDHLAGGYEYEEDRMSATGEVKSVKLKKHADLGSNIFLLVNLSQRLEEAMRFINPQRIEHTGAGGGPIEVNNEVDAKLEEKLTRLVVSQAEAITRSAAKG